MMQGLDEMESQATQVKRKKWILGIVLMILLPISAGIAFSVGAVQVTFGDIGRVLMEFLPDALYVGSPLSVEQDILMQIRLPRVIMAGIAGAALASAGVVYQAIFRNPMADPYVIGVSSGAALGASLAILIPLPHLFGGHLAIPVFAFLGALLTIVLVFRMARVGHTAPVMTLLLAGIAISSVFSALVSLLTYLSGDKIHQVVFWMMGGFGGATWKQVGVMLPYTLLGFLIILLFTRELNGLLLGEETAQHLGIDTHRVKTILLLGSSLLVAGTVSTSGIIGFVGLVVPHFIRMVAGPDHKYLLPTSALCGASLLILTDALSRVLLAPRELPVGILTALIGAPLFLYLLRKRKKLRYFNG